MPPTLKRLRPPSPRDGWYEISPAEAQWLAENGAKNRPLKEHRAARIAAEILAGTWRANGESVVFDDKGRCVDGQHRLRACVLANRPIVVYCVFDVPAKHFASFDQGVARGGNDLAALMDFANANTVAAVARLAMQYADGTLTKTGKQALSTDALRLYMERHRERLASSVAVAAKQSRSLARLVPISHAAFVYYMNAESQDGRATEFLEKLASGAGLHKGNALLLFRQRMQDLVGKKHALRQVDKLALMIKTWNAFVSGKSVGVLRWIGDVEPFPRFNGNTPP